MPPEPVPSGPDLSPQTVGRPRSLLVAAVLVGAQGLLVVVLAVLEVADLTGSRATMGVTTFVFLLAYGVGLVACAWGLAGARSWARAPVVVAQLIDLGLAWNVRASNTTLSVGLTVVAVATLAAVLAPTSRTALDAL